MLNYITAPIFEISSTSLYYLSSLSPLVVVLLILNILPQIKQINILNLNFMTTQKSLIHTFKYLSNVYIYMSARKEEIKVK